MALIAWEVMTESQGVVATLSPAEKHLQERQGDGQAIGIQSKISLLGKVWQVAEQLLNTYTLTEEGKNL